MLIGNSPGLRVRVAAMIPGQASGGEQSPAGIRITHYGSSVGLASAHGARYADDCPFSAHCQTCLQAGYASMNRMLIATVVFLSFVSVGAVSARAGETAPLFDGRSFAGWEGNEKVFRVQDGAIVGGSLDKPVARNEFLCTKREYSDFELRAKFKILGKGANGGIQFRSQRIPNHHEVSGYQADLGDGWWGSLYDESRRNKILVKADLAEFDKILHRDDWNDYRILAVGKRIQLWINGLCTVDYMEPDDAIPQRGVIGVQIHGGPPSEAWYKEITIEEK
jgi:hypothetical protein